MCPFAEPEWKHSIFLLINLLILKTELDKIELKNEIQLVDYPFLTVKLLARELVRRVWIIEIWLWARMILVPVMVKAATTWITVTAAPIVIPIITEPLVLWQWSANIQRDKVIPGLSLTRWSFWSMTLITITFVTTITCPVFVIVRLPVVALFLPATTRRAQWRSLHFQTVHATLLFHRTREYLQIMFPRKRYMYVRTKTTPCYLPQQRGDAERAIDVSIKWRAPEASIYW